MTENKAILIGRLGKDPELSYTQAGNAVAKFSLATSERYTDKSGQKQEQTEWHNIVVWGKQAESVNQYLAKGRQVYIEGKITTRSWDDQQSGQKRYMTEIVARQVKFLGSKDDRGQAQGGQAQGGQYQGGQAQGGQAQGGQAQGNFFNGQSGNGQQGNPNVGGPPDDDDIPF